MSALTVRAVGPSCLVQDHGRAGHAHLGVPGSGVLDRPAGDLANRLVGNPADAAVLELLLGGLEAVTDTAVWVALTGADAPLHVDGRAVATRAAVRLPAGAVLRVGVPRSGARCYLAVGGGIATAPVLGSRATDTLSGLGPPPIAPGDVLALGTPRGGPAPLDTPPGPPPGPAAVHGPAALRVDPGPRAGWCGPDVLAELCGSSYVVGERADRVGLRLQGPPLVRTTTAELPPEGVVLGAVQVPPDGVPVVFLADHPPTGGYPVVAVVRRADVWRCAQLRPGDPVRFTPARPEPWRR